MCYGSVQHNIYIYIYKYSSTRASLMKKLQELLDEDFESLYRKCGEIILCARQ